MPFCIPQGSGFPGEYYHPRELVRRIMAAQNKDDTKGTRDEQGATNLSNGFRGALRSVLEALMDKLSSLTMIDRNKVEPAVSLSTYGLDSLVSVELGNWIRRETSVDLALTANLSADNLSALADSIPVQKK